MINGPEAFTPDGEFILGESDVRGFFVAAGFCAHGIAGAGGIGKVMADWIVHGEPRVRPVEDGHPPVRRAVPVATLRARARRRGLLDVLRHPLSGRGAARRVGRSRRRRRTRGSPTLGAEFGEKSGWERANWFASNEDASLDDRLRPRGWAGEHWSTRDRRRAHRDPRARGPVRRVELRQDRGRAGRTPRRSSSGCRANDVDRPTGTVDVHPDAERRAAASSAT